MEVVYRSFDGQYFPTPEECQEHEAKYSLPADVDILNDRAELTYEPYDAMFIINRKNLSDEDFEKVCHFLRFVDLSPDVDAADGYGHDEGVYFWSMTNDRYSRLSFRELKVLKGIYEKYSNPVDGERS